MAAWEEFTRKLTAVVGSSVNHEGGTATIECEDEKQKALGLVFSVSALPAAISIMAARLTELVGHIDPYDRAPTQTLQMNKISAEMNTDGAVGILIGLQGGAHLPIQCTREILQELRDNITDLLAATDLSQRN